MDLINSKNLNHSTTLPANRVRTNPAALLAGLSFPVLCLLPEPGNVIANCSRLAIIALFEITTGLNA
jgi:hypothetical protein